jgi:hypothetical protein
MTPTPDPNWTMEKTTESGRYWIARWDYQAKRYDFVELWIICKDSGPPPYHIRSINPIPEPFAPELPKERIE